MSPPFSLEGLEAELLASQARLVHQPAFSVREHSHPILVDSFLLPCVAALNALRVLL